MYPLIGGTSASCAIEAKGNTGNTITFFGGMSFNSSGMTGNAVNGYGTSKYKPQIANNHAGYYLGTATDNGYRSVCGIQGVQGQFHNYINVSTDNGFRNGSDGSGASYTYSGTEYYWISTRVSTTSCLVYSNGTYRVTIPGTSSAGTYTGTTGMGAPGLMNTDGTASEYNGQRIQFLHFGTALTSTDVTNLNTIIQTFQTSLGRNR